MALTLKQEERRRKSLGGSDIPILLGEIPGKSPWDVWADKKWGLRPWDRVPDNVTVGNAFESVLVQYAARRLKVNIVRNQFRAHPKLPFHANLDAVISGKPEFIEAKSTSATEDWGEEGTSAIPLRVLAQVQWGLMVTGYQLAHVVVHLAGGWSQKIRLYRIEPDPEAIERLETFGKEWWEKHVVGDEQPNIPLSHPNEDVLRRIHRKPDSCVEVDESLVKEWLEAKEQTRFYKRKLEEARARLLQALGNAEMGTCPLGDVTYMLRSRAGYAVRPGRYRELQFEGKD